VKEEGGRRKEEGGRRITFSRILQETLMQKLNI